MTSVDQAKIIEGHYWCQLFEIEILSLTVIETEDVVHASQMGFLACRVLY
jgi:hypothetical protein